MYFAYTAPIVDVAAQASRLESPEAQRWQTSFASYQELVEYFSAHAERLRDITTFEKNIAHGLQSFALRGYCAACRRKSRFWANFLSSKTEWRGWRETLICLRCRLVSRLRAAIDFIDSALALPEASVVYTTESKTPFVRALVRRFRTVIGSEYAPDRARRFRSPRGARHEDLTKLTFADRSLDLICTNDVLEHVPDYKAALRECFRCLRPGGHLVVTVPFMLLAQETQVRARVEPDGSIEYLTEPEFHDDPLDPQGVLCFYNYGWDLLAEMKNAGFADARVRVYWSLRRGYLGVPQTFITAQR